MCGVPQFYMNEPAGTRNQNYYHVFVFAAATINIPKSAITRILIARSNNFQQRFTAQNTSLSSSQQAFNGLHAERI
jgi:hypothetical protein